ncbi:DUF6708 domain-containing protein [Buttiauxella ferragutiae]|uniref:DUF6708 domain-containing protein n=1 Tax=Buttiauxella ferragutiae TaxID=82989 RepID=UPI003523BD68
MENRINNITYDDMKVFFINKVKELKSWPYNGKNVVIAPLPEHVTVNPDKPSMFCFTEINDDYMEFRRSAFWLVSGTVVMAFMISMMSIAYLAIAVCFFYDGSFESTLFLCFFGSFFGLYVLPMAARIAFFIPHDLPVRLNRKTQKVYIASLILHGNIFRLRPELIFQEMDWKYIEGWVLHRSVGKGTPYYGLHLVENKSGDINRLQQACLYRTGAPWSTSEMEYQINNIMSTWSYCQHFMNYLPVPDETEKDKNFVFLSNNWLFKWPEAMDKASRSSG